MSTDPKQVLTSDAHRAALIADANRQFAFFDASLDPAGGFHTLDTFGAPLPGVLKELHGTTRMVHSYALGKLAGRTGGDAMIDHGMQFLWHHHRDADHGGYLWGLDGTQAADTRKLAYGHVFVLLAASSAKAVGHPDADRLMQDVDHVLDAHFWEEDQGLFCDEWNRDWTPFSEYRGMNANMHGVEALLAAFEASGREKFLVRAGRILDFFLGQVAPAENWRLPEHYQADWSIDRSYAGNPMFRPAGTTPGHSFELARLLLQYSELAGGVSEAATETAQNVVDRAMADAWDPENGGLFYTLSFDGTPDIRDRYWWPVTEALGVYAALLKVAPTVKNAETYAKLWAFAESAFIDAERGGWYPEIDANGHPTNTQFVGKPDIYHSIQAVLLPLTPNVSKAYGQLAGVLG